MPDLTGDFQSLTRFRRQLDSQSTLDLAAHQDTREGIRQGLGDAKKDSTRIARVTNSGTPVRTHP